MSSAAHRSLLLVDYRGEFFPRHKRRSTGTNLARLTDLLLSRGVELEIAEFSEEVVRRGDLSGTSVFYQSAQDPDLLYKSYLEDVALALELKGARLRPAFCFFRAHHNKVMMELLRSVLPQESLGSLLSRVFGTYEEFERSVCELEYPVVLKASAGDSSKGVLLARDPSSARRAAKRLMRSLAPSDWWLHLRRRLGGVPSRPHSMFRNKLVAQSFVPGLSHDFKAVWMAGRVFVETRETRKGDFRASGSGLRSFPQELPPKLLDIVDELGWLAEGAYASIDLMVDGGGIHVGEMQFLHFGTTPVVRAPHAWVKGSAGWRRLSGPFSWEEELARAMATVARVEAPRQSAGRVLSRRDAQQS